MKQNSGASLDTFYALKTRTMLGSSKFYRYFIGSIMDQDIFMQESCETISNGTTGLSTWIVSLGFSLYFRVVFIV